MRKGKQIIRDRDRVAPHRTIDNATSLILRWFHKKLAGKPESHKIISSNSVDSKVAFTNNKLKSLKVAKSKYDDGGAVDSSVDAGDVNGVL